MIKQLKPLVGLAMAVMGLLAVFLAVEINHVWSTAATTNTVSFSGEGTVSVTPDIAAISASIVTQAADSKTAQDQNSTKSKAVTDFLKNQGIDEKDIKTSSYNVYPQYRYSTAGQQTISGYQVSQAYDVKVRDLDKVSTILDGLVSAGANQVNNLGLQVDNPDAAQAEARQKAIDDAKKKASELQGQVGIKLGRIVNFSENSNGSPMPMYALDAKNQSAGMGGGPEISVGQNEVTVNVTITYQIK
jgi:uncharacterized protein YggE